MRRLLTVLLMLVFVAAACGDGEPAGTTATTQSATSVSTAPSASTTTTEPVTTTEVATATTTSTVPAEPASDAAIIAETLLGLFDNLDGIQAHYAEAIMGMSRAVPSVSGTRPTGVRVSLTPEARTTLWTIAAAPFAQQGPPPGFVPRIPSGFLAPVGPRGFVGAPGGACGAGAAAEAAFESGNGVTITSEVLEEEQISTIDFGAIVGDAEETLDEALGELIRPGDQRLATPEGWNEAVWEPLAELQEPAESLMDYHVWTVAGDLEDIVLADIRTQLEMMGTPEQVLTAFDESDAHGWIAGSDAEAGDRLAGMDIEAEFFGGIDGDIREERDFVLPEPGALPEFSPLVGDGTVTMEHPELGPIEFDVELEWTGWDELGRVNEGILSFVSEETGYEIFLEIEPDGTKEGDVLLNGVVIGRAELIVTEEGSTIEFTELGE